MNHKNDKKVKLVWRFSGTDALKTAEHHLIHLQEFINREPVEALDISTSSLTDFSAITFMIVKHCYVEKLRLALKPHQGLLVD